MELNRNKILADLKINDDAIISAVQTSQKVLSELELQAEFDNLHKSTIDILSEVGEWTNITDSIIDVYFYNTQLIIDEAEIDAETEYEIDGENSYFMLNGKKY